MSKFWDENDNESEDEVQSADGGSDEAEDSGDDDEERDNKKDKETRGPARRFEMEDWESSSEEKRQVKTVKEKLEEQLVDCVSRLTEAMDIADTVKEVPADVDRSKWPVVCNYTEVMEEVGAGLQLLEKYKGSVSKDGIPGFFIRALATFVDLMAQSAALLKSDPAFKNCIPRDNLKALEKAGRYAKVTVEGNAAIAKLLAEYRKDPKAERWLDPASKEQQKDDSEDDDEKPAKPETGTGPKRGTREYWVKQPGDSSSSSDEGDDGSWLNDSAESGEEGDEKKEGKAKKAKPGAKSKKHKGKTTSTKKAAAGEDGDEPEEDEASEGDLGKSQTVAEPLEEERALKTEDVDRLTEEISQLRGRKGTDYKRLLQRLELILPKAFNDVQRVRLLLLFVNTRFDSVRTTKARLSADHWRAAARDISHVLRVLRANPSYRLVEIDANFAPLDEDREGDEEEIGVLGLGVGGGNSPADEEARKAKHAKKKEKAAALAADSKAAGKTVIAGSLFALLERLDSAFLRTLQQIDPHTQEYVTRLADDPTFLALAKDMLNYQLSINDSSNASKTAHRIISHMYFRCFESSTAADGTPTTRKVDYTRELQDYASIIYKAGGARRKAQAMLMCIYHYALQDNFSEARDRMLMSHLQDKASLMDIETQVLFNRTNVQIGLCAFRNGLVREAHSALSEIYAGGRVRELLAQGTSSQRYQDRDKEQEKVERARMMPFHMHINLELLETCHLIAAMMLEVPAMAAERYSRGSLSDGGDRGRIMSKYLRKLVDYHERQVFAGPPETTRDFVVAAARALGRGNWRKTTRLLLAMPAWELVEDSAKVKKMLSTQIQEAGLKTYLFTYCACFETLSVDMLAELFQLTPNRVHAIVSGMMLNEELKASWNQPNNTIVMHNVEPTTLQNSCLKYTQRVAAFLESNEALLDSRHGSGAGHLTKDGKRDRDDRGDGKSDRPRQDRGDRGDREQRGDRGYGGGYDRGDRGGDRNRGGGGGGDDRRRGGYHQRNQQDERQSDDERQGGDRGGGGGYGGYGRKKNYY